MLNLASNEIDKLDDMNNNIKVLPRLEELNLSSNQIKRLDKQQFMSFMRLRKLDLNYNNLSFIDLHCLQGVSFIEHVDLSNNNLSDDDKILNTQGLNHLTQLNFN